MSNRQRVFSGQLWKSISFLQAATPKVTQLWGKKRKENKQNKTNSIAYFIFFPYILPSYDPLHF